MTPRTDRILNVLILILIGLLGGLCAWYRRGRSPHNPPPHSAPSSRAAVGAPPPLIYLQTDPRWRDARIGGSGETIGAVGCTLCCVAMALEHHGIATTPGELNAALNARGGYTDRGWVKWDAVEAIVDRAVRIEIPPAPSPARIDAALAAGNPVIAKVLIWGVTSHWVLIVAKEGQDYLIKDPLGDGAALERLSKYRSGVHAIRIPRPVADGSHTPG